MHFHMFSFGQGWKRYGIVDKDPITEVRRAGFSTPSSVALVLAKVWICLIAEGGFLLRRLICNPIQPRFYKLFAAGNRKNATSL